METRVIHDGAGEGTWNMSVDEALLRSAAENGVTTLRLYRWQPATLSLGYFQKLSDRQLHAASRDLQVVRRASGGGAILHHHELTYSFATPASGSLHQQGGELYQAFHQTLIQQLIAFGIDALSCESPPVVPRDKEPFLCFRRRADGDVLLGDRKIIGSAQRRHRGALLQHGSIIWSRSEYAPEIGGVFQDEVPAFEEAKFLQAWMERLGARLAVTFSDSKLTQSEQRLAAEIQAAKFSHDTWLSKRI